MLCHCEPEFYKNNGICLHCPLNMICPGLQEDFKIITPSGYYPSPSIENPTIALKCDRPLWSRSSCNPDNVYPYQCADGYGGRLCSKCIDGYSKQGSQW